MFASLEMPSSLSAAWQDLLPPLAKQALTYERKPVTPMQAVYRENKLTVWKTETPVKSDKVPLLLVPALINRHYILDLSETNSLCSALSEAGYEVYLVDWGTPGPEDRWQTFSEVITGPMRRMVRKVTRLTGKKPVLFGYCLGGIISNIYTACWPDSVAGLVAMTAPVDFSKAGYMALWTKPEYLNPYLAVGAMGNLPPEMIQNGFVALKPAQFLKKWRSAWEKQDSASFLDSFFTLETWVNDNVPFPGGTWQEYIHWLYQDNRLYTNSLWIDSHHASLENIQCPVLTIVAEQDHIVPPDSALPLHEMAGSDDKEVLSLPGGHVGIIASGKLFPKLVNALTEWLDERQETFA
ncbi:MAG: alpha/beta fold hydrolase [Candidatus Sericytochromatia bacterium]